LKNFTTPIVIAGFLRFSPAVADGGAGSFDTLFGEEGHDTLTVQDSEFGGNLFGGTGDDTLIGSNAAFSFNTLEGNEGNDTLQAGTLGGASLSGGDGDDVLAGGAGDDQYIGGTGVDQFVFGQTWTNPDTFGFQDIIWDFEDGIEKIDLSASGLSFTDLTIDDSGFSAIITSTAGQIEVVGFGQQGFGQLTEADFLF
jgi:Ca2+-binding RTX toxin-like protein